MRRSGVKSWAGVGGAIALLAAPAHADARPSPLMALGHAAPAQASLLRVPTIGVATDPPAGAGPEFTRYVSEPEARNQFIVGGLLAWMGLLVGGLMVLEKRLMTALAIGGGGLAIGVALMLSAVI